MIVVQVAGMQEVKVFIDKVLLENLLHFKTTSTAIMMGEDVKDYPHMPAD